ncbi:rhomboid family intramembrane serine protease [Cognatishimia maritima]|uniref:Membrane associated serine protease, rhomboid family n=1 Tax=Cognatishimia maritima TaxID=870908 RepID=A0A1M5TR82_9RHOB|nr:rhomboid family intramembrane serine protease [Cognatishimia maritima]SHH53234.1 Membrane associated serine protease, rhomboid family [Cognatishimia maritima]
MFPIRDHNPSGRTPFVTYALIALNVVIYLYSWPLEDTPRQLAAFYSDYALFPARIANGFHYEGLFTSMFLHGGFMHLIGNMLFLWIFGDNLEDEMGHIRFLLFYLVGGIAAGLTQVFSEPASMVPTIGASGAVAAVMGGYLLLYPKARVDILLIFIIIFKAITVPAWLVLGIWFGLQFFNGITVDTSAGGVAYWAHAGGFIAGVVLTLPLWAKRGGARFWRVTDGHPPHPDAKYGFARSNVPKVRRRK